MNALTPGPEITVQITSYNTHAWNYLYLVGKLKLLS